MLKLKIAFKIVLNLHGKVKHGDSIALLYKIRQRENQLKSSLVIL